MMNDQFLKLLCCPIDGKTLSISDDGKYLINQTQTLRYKICNEIPMLLAEHAEEIV